MRWKKWCYLYLFRKSIFRPNDRLSPLACHTYFGKLWHSAPPCRLAAEKTTCRALALSQLSCGRHHVCSYWPSAPNQSYHWPHTISRWINMLILRPGFSFLWGVPCPCNAAFLWALSGNHFREASIQEKCSFFNIVQTGEGAGSNPCSKTLL